MIEGPIEEQTGPAERKSRWFKVDVLAVIQLIKKLANKKLFTVKDMKLQHHDK